MDRKGSASWQLRNFAPSTVFNNISNMAAPAGNNITIDALNPNSTSQPAPAALTRNQQLVYVTFSTSLSHHFFSIKSNSSGLTTVTIYTSALMPDSTFSPCGRPSYNPNPHRDLSGSTRVNGRLTDLVYSSAGTEERGWGQYYGGAREEVCACGM